MDEKIKNRAKKEDPDWDLRKRTKRFALRMINMYSVLPTGKVAQVIGNQVLRSGTSVGAHFREAHRARSNAEFISKMQVGIQELDETIYWLELLVESNTLPDHQISDLKDEANQLLAIFTASVKTAKSRK